uniref:Ig-like domain-containing protein n=1 Tax=Pelusios castaneus TaxID=367368 RepID=A0A8C8SXR1_9SAUR
MDMVADGYMQVTPVQTPLSVTRPEMKTARMICKVDGVDFSNNPIHWYRQSPGAPPKRILYMTSQSVSMDEGFNSNKFEATRQNDKFTFKLDVHRLTSEDAGTYYCAYWDRTVSESHKQPVQKPSLHSEPQPLKSNKPVTSFFLPLGLKPAAECPIWFLQYDMKTDKNEKKAENAVYGEIWPSHDDKKSYSISSWLTIDKDRSKNYRCTYQHERKEDSRLVLNECYIMQQK